MPIESRYDETLQILFVTAIGVLSLTDIMNHITRRADAGKLPCKELFDATKASNNMNSSEVASLAEAVRQKFLHGPTAIVVSDDKSFGMSRMLEILSDVRGGPKFGIFRDPNDALEWLKGVDVTDQANA